MNFKLKYLYSDIRKKSICLYKRITKVDARKLAKRKKELKERVAVRKIKIAAYRNIVKNKTPEEKMIFAKKTYERAMELGLDVNNSKDKYSMGAISLVIQWINNGNKPLKKRQYKYLLKYNSWIHVESVIDASFLEHSYPLSILLEGLDMFMNHINKKEAKIIGIKKDIVESIDNAFYKTA